MLIEISDRLQLLYLYIQLESFIRLIIKWISYAQYLR